LNTLSSRVVALVAAQTLVLELERAVVQAASAQGRVSA
jgi:hypothetical protein